jgi:hypothetical protein
MPIVYKILVISSDGNRLHGKPRHRTDDNRLQLCDSVQVSEDVVQWRSLVNKIMDTRVLFYKRREQLQASQKVIFTMVLVI